MTRNWQKLASLAQEICTLWFQFFGTVFASKSYPFKNIFIRASRPESALFAKAIKGIRFSVNMGTSPSLEICQIMLERFQSRAGFPSKNANILQFIIIMMSLLGVI